MKDSGTKARRPSPERSPERGGIRKPGTALPGKKRPSTTKAICGDSRPRLSRSEAPQCNGTSLEGATQESPARQCREREDPQLQVPKGRHNPRTNLVNIQP